MRRAVVLAMPLVLGACSGLGKFISDTATLPGANPNAPTGESENLLRARGENATGSVILPQGGNIWPDAPPPMPTLSDVSKNPASIDDLMKSTGGAGMEFPSGGSMSAGESDAIKNGVHVFSGSGVSDSTPDVGVKNGAHKVTAPIVIPNGDGTSTVISPDGAIKTVKTMGTTQN